MVFVLSGGQGQVFPILESLLHFVFTKYILERQHVRGGFNFFRVELVQLVDMFENAFELATQSGLLLLCEFQAGQEGDFFNIK